MCCACSRGYLNINFNINPFAFLSVLAFGVFSSDLHVVVGPRSFSRVKLTYFLGLCVEPINKTALHIISMLDTPAVAFYINSILQINLPEI